MDYNKLKELLVAKNITIAKVAKHIGRSQNWFHTAIRNDTMTIADLEKILKLCKMSMGEFFGGQPGLTVVNEPSERETRLAEENVELLRENRNFRKQLDELKGKTVTKTTKANLYK